MKNNALALMIALIVSFGFSACKMDKNAVSGAGNDNSSTASSSPAQPSPAASTGAENLDGVVGSYVGPFGDNKITLLITKAGGGMVSGRSIVGGNDRPFDGTITVADGNYIVEAREPGDHKDDGVFKFTISQAKLDEAKGTWKANDPKRPEKSYTLERRKFQYRADVGNWPEASQRLLKAEDVENLPKADLQFMRNEIFARHGYCFAKKELRQQFEREAWYVPNTVDIKGYLTDIEKKNIALIKRYEKYADDYGDEYGR